MNERLNGTTVLDLGDGLPVEVARPRQRKGKAKAAPKARTAKCRRAEQDACRWSRWYTWAAVAASAGLNGYQATVDSQAASWPGLAAAAVLSGGVPVAVWALAKVGSSLWRAGWRKAAGLLGTVASCGLALSLVHVAHALGALTGCGDYLAVLLAVVVDVGLICCEGVHTLLQSQE